VGAGGIGPSIDTTLNLPVRSVHIRFAFHATKESRGFQKADCAGSEVLRKAAQSVRAFAYLRTSSATNIGEDKDSGRRQLDAVEAYAKCAGIELVGTYHDEAVKGSDPIDTRPGFAAMLEALEANGTRTPHASQHSPKWPRHSLGVH
jgi:Resolvase, N terminal domain